jgi:cardiolipin synthase (CMP-forming)
LLAPTLISLVRIPLAYAFISTLDKPWLAIAILVVAGLSDVIDGWVARRLQQATPTGAVVDGVLDKVFAAVIIGSLVASGHLSPLEAGLLGMRELGELPLVVWWATHRPKRRARAEEPQANWLGKVATVLQFLAIGAVLTQGAARGVLLASAAFAGIASAVCYWRRELSVGRTASSNQRGTKRVV